MIYDKDIREPLFDLLEVKYGKTRILETSEPALRELYEYLITRPDQRIRILMFSHRVSQGEELTEPTVGEEAVIDPVKEGQVRGTFQFPQLPAHSWRSKR